MVGRVLLDWSVTNRPLLPTSTHSAWTPVLRFLPFLHPEPSKEVEEGRTQGQTGGGGGLWVITVSNNSRRGGPGCYVCV